MITKMSNKKVIVPHDDFLDFMDAIHNLRPKNLDEIMVSSAIYYKLTSGGKWQHRNHIGEGKPILEFKWWGGAGWYKVTDFRGINRDSSAYTDRITVYWLQFDDETQIEITAE